MAYSVRKNKKRGSGKLRKKMQTVEVITIGLIGRKEVAKLYGIHLRTVEDWESSGKIPKRVRMAGAHPRWSRAQIIKHIQSLEQ